MSYEWVKMTLVLWLKITVADVDPGPQYNHLLENIRGSGTEYSISYTSDKPLRYRFEEMFRARVEMECQAGYGIEKVPEALQESLPYGSPYVKYICNAFKLEILE